MKTLKRMTTDDMGGMGGRHVHGRQGTSVIWQITTAEGFGEFWCRNKAVAASLMDHLNRGGTGEAGWANDPLSDPELVDKWLDGKVKIA